MSSDKSKPKSFSIRKRMASFRHAFNGIRLAIVSEHNLRIHIIVALLAIIAGFYFKINSSEWIILVLAIGIVFAAEFFNTAIESLADFISPGHHADIGKIKDISAAAVLIAAIAAIVTGILLFWPHIKTICKT